MTTARRRKVPIRSVGIRRVKSRKSQNAKRFKTFRRKSRNIVMRGGGNNLSLYYESNILPSKCFIIKKEALGRDDLYLFFAADISLEDIQEYVCNAIGLDTTTVTFEPEFNPQKPTNTSFKLNNLFVKLSGWTSYSTIESGYLTRVDNINDKEQHKNVVISTKHKTIMNAASSAPEIKKWQEVFKNLKTHGHVFLFFKDKELGLSSYVAEDECSYIEYRKREAEKNKCSSIIRNMNTNIKNNMYELQRKIGRWPERIEINAKPGNKSIPKEEIVKYIREYLRGFNYDNYDDDVRELKNLFDFIKQMPEYQDSSPFCKEWVETELGFKQYKTIEEIVDQFYPKEIEKTNPDSIDAGV